VPLQRWLRRQPDVYKLWWGQTISQFGSGITGSALPLTAVLTLGASPAQMGLLIAAEAVPLAIFGLFAGVWVDRLRRRPLMIGADVGRAVLLLSIPVAALMGRLQIGQLFLVAALMGILTVLFDVAYQSFLPGLVTGEQLLTANSRLAASVAMAEVVTPGLTGVLVQLVSAPLTLLLDSLSFLCSAGSVATIRRELPAVRRAEKGALFREIGEGLTAVARHPLLRALAGYRVTGRFFGNGIGALYTLYGLHDLALGPVLLGLTVGIGGMSNLVGTFLVGPLTRRYGVPRCMLTAAAVGSFTAFLVPLAHGPLAIGFGTLALCQAFDVIQPIYEVNALSLRQSITPPHVLGRVNAAMQVLEDGVGPLGAVVAGVLAGQIGVRPTLFLAALGASPSILWLVCSPLPALRATPSVRDSDSVPVG
jgi:MFS family permease